ncbi:MAG: trypsin-like peptidase domain-containing protein, partial [Ilumatobacteraceae bacterium]
MERSEWPDDDAAGDASNDGSYPPAPLPAHERTWRHPSEIGSAGWVHTEPPITIGRGLLVTTGAIGGLLSLAVLWAMLPSAGRGDDASAIAVTSTAGNVLTSITVRPDTFVATTVDGRSPSTTLRAGSVVVPASQSIPTTTSTARSPQTTVGSDSAQSLEQPPVAVGVGDSLVVTTARAVKGRTSITMTDASGQQHDATVLMVDPDLGLALLSAVAASMPTSYAIGPAAAPGDVVTVLGYTPTSAKVGLDANGHLTLDSWSNSTAEGTPVVNAAGQLVGICSHGDSGPLLISVANVGAMLPATKSWLGVHVTPDDQGALVIDRVAADGPAAAAGIVVGD